MPELPEVETTKRGVEPHITMNTIRDIDVWNSHLRLPVNHDLTSRLRNQTIFNIHRRGKYLWMTLSAGYLLIHLGMSGSLRICHTPTPRKKHDHIILHFDRNIELRYHDPRRFGLFLWQEESPLHHSLLQTLGVEPLTAEFNARYLLAQAITRRIAVKSYIMDHHVVVGVGNIYASEALFLANIHPQRFANTLELSEYARLVKYIKLLLRRAIQVGGTTLRDFVAGDSKPGYFKQSLLVYGREHLACVKCASTLQSVKINQRSSVFCPNCQI
ncbi:MAG: bifunctional DNA-formamidopyrimidine glycosylase/DNA-(apurinic or apyrimidinic site) lyase [Legionellales bacterium]|nr:bifunctional DNA-formamidopyrimidine glycosylase/DNA-(apurinic or apyrimidinic site) lyase [Legionellales bacterium]